MTPESPTPCGTLQADIALLREQTLALLQDVQLARKEAHSEEGMTSEMKHYLGKHTLIEAHIALTTLLFKIVHASQPQETTNAAPHFPFTKEDIMIIAHFLEREKNMPRCA